MKLTALAALLAAFAIAAPAAAQTFNLIVLPEDEPTLADDSPISADTVIDIDGMSDEELMVFGCRTIFQGSQFSRTVACTWEYEQDGRDCEAHVYHYQSWSLLRGGWYTTHFDADYWHCQ